MTKLLRLVEAGERLGISEKAVRRLIDAGLIAHVKVPGRGERPALRIPETAIADYIERNTIRPTNESETEQ